MSNEIDLDHVPARRRALRLPGYDYAQVGAYFVTICTRDRICVLGDVVDGEVRLSELGEMVNSVWLELPRHYPYVRLDAWVVMPNHVHGILLLEPDDDMAGAGLKPRAGLKPAPTGPKMRHGLPEVVRAFKTFSGASTPFEVPLGRRSGKGIITSMSFAMNRRWIIYGSTSLIIRRDGMKTLRTRSRRIGGHSGGLFGICVSVVALRNT